MGAITVERVRDILNATRGRPDAKGLCAQCPAAIQLDGAGDEFDLRIICGAMQRDRREATTGLNMTAAAAGFERNTSDAVLLRLKSDPSSVAGLCCGEGVPGSRNSYAFCPVWQAEVERVREGALSLVPDDVPESYATEGFEPQTRHDRAALDELAG